MTIHEALTEELTHYYAFDNQPTEDYISLGGLVRHVITICRICGWTELYFIENENSTFEFAKLTDDTLHFVKNIFPVRVEKSVSGDDMEVCYMRRTSYGRKTSATQSAKNVAERERVRKIQNVIE